MTKMIERTRNVNDTATQPAGITLTGTSVTLAAANANRIFFEAVLEGDTAGICAFIKLQAASVDNNFQGEPLYVVTVGNSNVLRLEYRMSADNIYTGEISGLAALGSPKVFITEY